MIDFTTPNYIKQMHLNKLSENKVKFKEDYLLQLQNIEWVKKRKLIKNRDDNKCNNCENVNDLQVHHTLYFNNKKLWEYDDSHLITLCRNCHQEEHRLYGVGNFKRSIKYANDILNKVDSNK
jgi:5-methylcytosine-specific restriction endonuclease McrA